MPQPVLFICVECGADLEVLRDEIDMGELPTLVEAKDVPTCHQVGGHDWHRRYTPNLLGGGND